MADMDKLGNNSLTLISQLEIMQNHKQRERERECERAWQRSEGQLSRTGDIRTSVQSLLYRALHRTNPDGHRLVSRCGSAISSLHPHRRGNEFGASRGWARPVQSDLVRNIRRFRPSADRGEHGAPFVDPAGRGSDHRGDQE